MSITEETLRVWFGDIRWLNLWSQSSPSHLPLPSLPVNYTGLCSQTWMPRPPLFFIDLFEEVSSHAENPTFSVSPGGCKLKATVFSRIMDSSRLQYFSHIWKCPNKLQYGFVKTVCHYSMLLHVIDWFVNTRVVLFYIQIQNIGKHLFEKKKGVQIVSQLLPGSTVSGQEACAEPECHAQLWHGLSCVFILRWSTVAQPGSCCRVRNSELWQGLCWPNWPETGAERRDAVK